MIALKLRRSQLSLSNQKKPSKGISRHRVTRPDRSPGSVIQSRSSRWDMGGRSPRCVVWVFATMPCRADTIEGWIVVSSLNFTFPSLVRSTLHVDLCRQKRATFEQFLACCEKN